MLRLWILLQEFAIFLAAAIAPLRLWMDARGQSHFAQLAANVQVVKSANKYVAKWTKLCRRSVAICHCAMGHESSDECCLT
jgi:hypothetical protein